MPGATGSALSREIQMAPSRRPWGREKRHSQTGKRGHHLHAGVPKCFPHGARGTSRPWLWHHDCSVTDRPRPEQQGRRLESLPCSSASPPLLHLPLSTCRCRTCGRGVPGPVTPPALARHSASSRGLFQCRGGSGPATQSALGICPSPAYTLTSAALALNRGGMSCIGWAATSDTQKSQS